MRRIAGDSGLFFRFAEPVRSAQRLAAVVPLLPRRGIMTEITHTSSFSDLVLAGKVPIDFLLIYFFYLFFYII